MLKKLGFLIRLVIKFNRILFIRYKVFLELYLNPFFLNIFLKFIFFENNLKFFHVKKLYKKKLLHVINLTKMSKILKHLPKKKNIF